MGIGSVELGRENSGDIYYASIQEEVLLLHIHMKYMQVKSTIKIWDHEIEG